MERGEVWVANLNPPRGREIGKIRPVLLIQANELGPEVTPMVVVLPLTTLVDRTLRRIRVTLQPRDRLLKPCQVVADQPRALDRARLGDGPLTRLTSDETDAVELSLRAVLGMM